MKKILALAAVFLLLILGLVLLLRPGEEPTPSSAPEATAAPVTASAETAPPATEAPLPRTGLAVVEDLDVAENDWFFGLRCVDGMAYVMLQSWAEQTDVLQYRLAALDPQTASLTAMTELDALAGEMNYSCFDVTETEILLIDEYGERCAAFDRTGTFLEYRDYPTMSRENLGWRNRLLNDGCFWKEADYASFAEVSDGTFSHAVAFYDEGDRIHVLDEPYDAACAVKAHCLLTTRSTSDNGYCCALLDLDESVCLGTLELHPTDLANTDGVRPGGAVIGDGWVLLVAEWSGPSSTFRRVLFWYPESEDRRPLAEEVWTEQILTDRIAALTAELEPLGLRFHLDEAPESEYTPTTGLNVSESVCDLGASLFGQYRILSKLKDFTEKLPEGFIRELYSQMPGVGEEHDGLHIFIVRSIPGSAAAFANGWAEPMLICFATEEFSSTHPAHEFMHIIDYRLNAYYSTESRSMWSIWEDMNPDWAFDDWDWLDEAQQEEVMDYFVSNYARTNSNEDRAETFQMLFDCTGPLAEEWWYADRPKVQAKVACLIEMIREAFPSVQAVELAWWEKLPE